MRSLCAPQPVNGAITSTSTCAWWRSAYSRNVMGGSGAKRHSRARLSGEFQRYALTGISDNVRVGPPPGDGDKLDCRREKGGRGVLRRLDMHRRRTQVAVLDEAGHELFNRNVSNDVEKLGEVLVGCGPGTPVAFESTYGWSWLAELLEDLELEARSSSGAGAAAAASSPSRVGATPFDVQDADPGRVG